MGANQSAAPQARVAFRPRDWSWGDNMGAGGETDPWMPGMLRFDRYEVDRPGHLARDHDMPALQTEPFRTQWPEIRTYLYSDRNVRRIQNVVRSLGEFEAVPEFRNIAPFLDQAYMEHPPYGGYDPLSDDRTDSSPEYHARYVGEINATVVRRLVENMRETQANSEAYVADRTVTQRGLDEIHRPEMPAERRKGEELDLSVRMLPDRSWDDRA